MKTLKKQCYKPLITPEEAKKGHYRNSIKRPLKKPGGQDEDHPALLIPILIMSKSCRTAV